jgi:hypothetical protein
VWYLGCTLPNSGSHRWVRDMAHTMRDTPSMPTCNSVGRAGGAGGNSSACLKGGVDVEGVEGRCVCTAGNHRWRVGSMACVGRGRPACSAFATVVHLYVNNEGQEWA